MCGCIFDGLYFSELVGVGIGFVSFFFCCFGGFFIFLRVDCLERFFSFLFSRDFWRDC